MRRTEGRTSSHRRLRIGEELRHALAWILERGEVRDPGLNGIPVTVTEVRISRDLGSATVFVVPLGGAAMGTEIDLVMAALNRARPFLRRRMAQKVKLKRVPEIEFRADTSFDHAARIEGLIGGPSGVGDGEDPGSGDHGA